MANENSNVWASDLSINLLNETEVTNKDCINQSIQSILSTAFAECIFAPSFGSSLPNLLFENFSSSQGERLLDEILNDIKKWEERIAVIESDVSLVFDETHNELDITIPYLVLQSGTLESFNKIITL